MYYLRGLGGRTRAIALSKDGSQVLVAGYSRTGGRRTSLWDIKSEKLLNTVNHSDPVWALAVSPDGQNVLLGMNQGELELCTFQSRETLRSFEGQPDDVYCVAFVADGTQFVAGGADDDVRLFSVETGEVLHTYEHGVGATSLAAFPDGSKILTGTYEGTARIWDVKTGEVLWTCKQVGEITAVDVSSGGTMFLTACADGIARVWDLGGFSTEPGI